MEDQGPREDRGLVSVDYVVGVGRTVRPDVAYFSADVTITLGVR
jgi:hypothetical protein